MPPDVRMMCLAAFFSLYLWSILLIALSQPPPPGTSSDCEPVYPNIPYQWAAVFADQACINSYQKSNLNMSITVDRTLVLPYPYYSAARESVWDGSTLLVCSADETYWPNQNQFTADGACWGASIGYYGYATYLECWKDAQGNGCQELISYDPGPTGYIPSTSPGYNLTYGATTVLAPYPYFDFFGEVIHVSPYHQNTSLVLYLYVLYPHSIQDDFEQCQFVFTLFVRLMLFV